MSEKSEAKRDGAKLQKNSGRGYIQKGDAKWNGFIVDYKEFSKSFSLNIEQWAKTRSDAVHHRMSPLIKLILADRIRLAIIEWDTFADIVEYYQLVKHLTLEELSELIESR